MPPAEEKEFEGSAKMVQDTRYAVTMEYYNGTKIVFRIREEALFDISDNYVQPEQNAYIYKCQGQCIRNMCQPKSLQIILKGRI